MKRIKHKILHAFLRLINVTLLSISPVIMTFVFLKKGFENDTLEIYKLFILIPCLGLVLYINYRYFKLILLKTPFIKFDHHTIWISNDVYNFRDISECKLTGKYHYYKATKGAVKESTLREGMVMKFRDGKEFHIFNEFYKNLNDLKLQLYKPEGKVSAEIDYRQAKPINVIFNRCQFYVFRGYVFWGVMCLIIGKLGIFNIIYQQQTSLSYYVIILTILAWTFFYHSKFFNFFALSQHSITIKRKNMFWFNKSFKLKDMHEVVLDYYTTPPYHGNKIKQLRIILNDFTEHRFPSSLLKDEQWLSLEKLLTEQGISVRNDRNLDYSMVPSNMDLEKRSSSRLPFNSLKKTKL
ncbi:hypothetical protein N9L20_08975 [Flavobacteriaceae bacterium]|nr:hypothetical protein [Flavobacteriaceae bacterium]